MADADARLQQLLDAYGAFLRGAARKLCPTTLGITADEIEQEARIRLWQALKREREITDPASYLYRIAASAAIDAVRRVRARREGSLDDTGGAHADQVSVPMEQSPEALVAGREMTEQVAAALARLPDNRRRAVGLYLRGFSSAEVGALLGWTEAKARNLLYRGLADLRELLAHRSPGEGGTGSEGER